MFQAADGVHSAREDADGMELNDGEHQTVLRYIYPSSSCMIFTEYSSGLCCAVSTKILSEMPANQFVSTLEKRRCTDGRLVFRIGRVVLWSRLGYV